MLVVSGTADAVDRGSRTLPLAPPIALADPADPVSVLEAAFVARGLGLERIRALAGLPDHDAPADRHAAYVQLAHALGMTPGRLPAQMDQWLPFSDDADPLTHWFHASAHAATLARGAHRELSSDDLDAFARLHAAWEASRHAADRGLLADAFTRDGDHLGALDQERIAASALVLTRTGLDLARALGEHGFGAEMQAAGICVDDGVGILIVCDDGDSVVAGDHVLMLDLGGDDVHQDNAGASGLDLLWSGNNGFPIALGVELGGNDAYARPNYAQGAGSSTPGILLDLDGNDGYEMTDGFFGFGQGAGNLGGVGLAFDALGDDTWLATAATDPDGDSPGWDNTGFGILGGIGIALDAAGNDYAYGGIMTQGVGDFQALGLYVDAEGFDIRVATRYAQGFGDGAGLGILFDGTGDDLTWGKDRLTQGAGLGGTGAYLDLRGSDTYMGDTARGAAQEGPFWWPVHHVVGVPGPGLGLFFDLGAGRDIYSGAGCNGCTWGDGLAVDDA